MLTYSLHAEPQIVAFTVAFFFWHLNCLQKKKGSFVLLIFNKAIDKDVSVTAVNLAPSVVGVLPNKTQMQLCGKLKLAKGGGRSKKKKRTISTCTLCSTWKSVILDCVRTKITGNYFKVITQMWDVRYLLCDDMSCLLFYHIKPMICKTKQKTTKKQKSFWLALMKVLEPPLSFTGNCTKLFKYSAAVNQIHTEPLLQNKSSCIVYSNPGDPDLFLFGVRTKSQVAFVPYFEQVMKPGLSPSSANLSVTHFNTFHFQCDMDISRPHVKSV